MALAAPFPAAGTARVTVGSRTSARTTARTTARTSASTPDRRSARPTWSGLRLTARGRVVLMLLSTAFLLAVVVLSGRITAEAGTAATSPATASVVVERGESLWQIATAIAPDSDPRDVVTVIRELNGLGDSTVVAGQSIVVPIYGPAS